MKGVEIIHGFIYPSPAKDKNTDSSSDEDEEENEEYIDATDIKDVADGGSFIKASPLKVSTGTHRLVDLDLDFPTYVRVLVRGFWK